MRSYIDFNDGWTFHEGFSGALTTDAASGKSVRLPHTAVELPFSYFDERDYQRQFTYQKVFAAEPGWAGREITLLFDGAMANSVVYLNGVEIASHKDGYTPFAARLTGLEVRAGGSTSIDITRAGIDKAYGMLKLAEHTGIPLTAMLFYGDRLDEGGNDYPVLALGVPSVAVDGWEDTADRLDELLAGLAVAPRS